jgi:hypothetical protein
MKLFRPTSSGVFPRVLNDGARVADVALGNMTQFTFGLIRTEHGIFVAIEGKGSYQFSTFVHYGYVMEKLNLKYESDAQAVADFINDQISEKPGEYPRQLHQTNRYLDLCSDYIKPS